MSENFSTINSALEQLRLKLLDLTGRNRLLNFKHAPGKSLQFIEGVPSDIFRKIVDGVNKQSIAILGLPDPTRNDWIEKNGRLQRPDPKDWAKSLDINTNYDLDCLEEGAESSNLRVLMYSDDLSKHCRKIEREANLAIEETGANMLFLVLGFLEYPDQRDSDKKFISPLVSIPVSIKKKELTAGQRSSGVQQFYISYTGDDITENLSLKEKLKNDYDLNIPELPDEQIDINKYFSEINQVIKNFPGFSIKHRTSLCLLSFSNMLLVRDLDPSKWPSIDGKNLLIDHPIIRQVFQGSDNDDSAYEAFPKEHLVEEGPGASIPLVYDADSSQHSALIDVLALNKNLVIEGPPGTGKSQTITNLIAASISQGKKVLFVAEKLAALEVVKNRLTLAGLDPFILELHSNKTNKKRVLEEIGKRADFQPFKIPDLPRMQLQLDAHRKELKAYTDLINSTAYNSFGLTLHKIMWRAEKHRLIIGDVDGLSQVYIDDAKEISEFELGQRTNYLAYLSAQYNDVGGFDDSCTFWGFFPEEIIPGDEVKILSYFEGAAIWVESLSNALSKFSAILGGQIYNLTIDFCKDQIVALKKLLDESNQNSQLHLTPNFFKDDKTGAAAERAIKDFSLDIERYHALEKGMSVAIKNESNINSDVRNRLDLLRLDSERFGIRLGSCIQIKGFISDLALKCDQMSSSHSFIVRFLDAKEIKYNGSIHGLKKLEEFVDLIVNIPEDALHLQGIGLLKEGSVQALEELQRSQSAYKEYEGILSDYLYIDVLPDVNDIKDAILTLREGYAWHRIFQSKWRKAVRLHKSMQREKVRKSAQERLIELEQVVKLNDLKGKVVSSFAWSKYLDEIQPSTDFDINAHVELAKWNKSIRLISEELEICYVNPLECTPEKARTLKRDFVALKEEIIKCASSLRAVREILSGLNSYGDGYLIDKIIALVRDYLFKIESQLSWLEVEAYQDASLNDVILACDAALERIKLRSKINSNIIVQAYLGECYQSVKTDCDAALEALYFGQSIDALNLSPQLKYKLRSANPIEVCRSIIPVMEEIYSGLDLVLNLERGLSAFGKFDIQEWVDARADEELDVFVTSLKRSIAYAILDKDLIVPWSMYIARRAESQSYNASVFVDFLEKKKIKPEVLSDAYFYCAYSSIIRDAFRNIPELSRFTGLKHNQIREEFKRLDKEIISLRGKNIAYECVKQASPPIGRGGARVDDRTEMTLLNHLIPQQRPRMPVRKILMRAGASIQSLMPCFMMGPQAVAQFLTPGSIKFDLVIMDEASQLKPEEAIGSIARGGQLVVVGDPKQLPPTSFFSRMSSDEYEGDDGYVTNESESILEACSSHFKPTRSLRWHYRSQHHSLIAFSNHSFYNGNLVIFPSPYGQGGKLGVRAVYLANAIYENQTNHIEAKRVVDAVVEHINSRPTDSLGVVTLNIKQRDLIAELLEERLRSVKSADNYLDHWISDGSPLFIKNLENVQGDERDAIIISTTFGRPKGANAVRQNFGPISRHDGWRRLNVLFTRAKKSIVIYTSLRPEDIIVDSSTPRGTKSLRDYLEFVRTGNLPTFQILDREPDSEFEVSVIEMLKSHGYELTPQLGVAGYRIDIAVKHPDASGSYLAAIECDGATYHSALSVRDRDRIRQEILESLGWRGRVWRIWSTDWFRAPKLETEKLLSFLKDLREKWKPEYASGDSWTEEGESISNLRLPPAPEVKISNPPSNDSEDLGIVDDDLGDDDSNIEVRVGDFIRYVDIANPDVILSLKITRKVDDFSNGLVSEMRPIAQALLGAVVGDEVSLHLPGSASKIFKIIDIKRSDN